MTATSHVSTDSATRHPLILDVALTPDHIDDPSRRAHAVCIVVDVIRATTTLSVLFERGCRAVLVAPDVSTARAARAALSTHGPSMALAGEVGGLPPTGFDFGNSPADFSAHDLRNRDIIFVTTNGTKAIRACAGSRAILTGALRNATAVTRAAVSLALDHESSAATVSATPAPSSPSGVGDVLPGPFASEASDTPIDFDSHAEADIIIVCSGRGGRPAYDDTLCAGYLVRRLVEQAASLGVRARLREPARIALATLANAEHAGSLRDALVDSDAARAVERIGLTADLHFCAAVDAADVVPTVAGEVSAAGLPGLLRISVQIS